MIYNVVLSKCTYTYHKIVEFVAEFDELDTHLRNYKNELRALDEHILEKELALKEIQAMGNFQQEELLK